MNFLKRQSLSYVAVNGGTEISDFIKNIFICVGELSLKVSNNGNYPFKVNLNSTK